MISPWMYWHPGIIHAPSATFLAPSDCQIGRASDLSGKAIGLQAFCRAFGRYMPMTLWCFSSTWDIAQWMTI